MTRRAPSFSARTAQDRAPNALTAKLTRVRDEGRLRADLTETNPTRVGLALPFAALESSLARAPLFPYEPEPFGHREAREAVASFWRSRGALVDPADVALTASTSEAYAQLFALLCNPGDNVLVPRPSYPLFDALTTFAGVEPRGYALAPDFSLDLTALASSADARSRAVLVVSPHNPLGHSIGEGELAALETFCAERGLALIVDEVFADFSESSASPRTVLTRPALGCLSFVLSGLSKVAALPQLKVAWLAVRGPEDARAEAWDRLEHLLDAQLSVNAVSQRALPALLTHVDAIQAVVRERLERNRRLIRERFSDGGLWTPVANDGGWSSVLRLPDSMPEESVCLALLDVGVLAHPGHFYDFPRGEHLVVSRLVSPELLEEGLEALDHVLVTALL